VEQDLRKDFVCPVKRSWVGGGRIIKGESPYDMIKERLSQSSNSKEMKEGIGYRRAGWQPRTTSARSPDLQGPVQNVHSNR